MLRSRFSWIVLGCLAALAAAFVAGCSLDSGTPMGPAVDDTDGFVALDNTPNQPQFVTYSPEPGRSLAKPIAEYIQKKIIRKKGGELTLGTSATIQATLTILPASIPKNETISMALPQGDILAVNVGGHNGLTFGPHGLTFDPPAELTIRSEHLVLPEGDLYLYCWNKKLRIWEPTDQKVEVTFVPYSYAIASPIGPMYGQVQIIASPMGVTIIKAQIHHFSHYAFGARR